MIPIEPGDKILLPEEVAKLFRVDPKTVTRWAKAGRIPFILTPGGHHRFRLKDIQPLLNPEPKHDNR